MLLDVRSQLFVDLLSAPPLNQIQQREQEDPHQIHEVPVEPCVLRVPRQCLAAQALHHVGDFELRIERGGARPLVINLHGYTGSPAQQEGLTAMNALADTEGFLVAYPQGLGSPADWNAGACCSAVPLSCKAMATRLLLAS